MSGAVHSDALKRFRRKWNASDNESAVANACSSLTAPWVRLPPVDPVTIATKVGAKVTTLPNSSSSLGNHGALKVRDGNWHIGVPANLSPERRRFSIAHEIGHILLFNAVADSPALVRELGSTAIHPQVERLCNLAAAHILMPSKSVFGDLSELGTSTARNILNDLSTRYYVSYEAMARRIPEVLPEWTLIIWEYRTDHPKGPAWRTARSQPRTGGAYIPDGLSSGRLSPDIVTQSATHGFSYAPVVEFKSPSVTVLLDAKAWRSRRSSMIPLHDDLPQKFDPLEKVFLISRFQRG